MERGSLVEVTAEIAKGLRGKIVRLNPQGDAAFVMADGLDIWGDSTYLFALQDLKEVK